MPNDFVYVIAENVGYDPADPGDWLSVPDNVKDALDELADRITNGPVASHASTHISGGTDEIDGDKLDIDFNPSNYTPDDSIPEADSVDELAAHLKGIDDALGSEASRVTYQGARNRNVSNTYLMSHGVFTNVVPIVTAEALTLIGISASTRVNETWTAEIHNNGVLIPGATLSLAGVDENTRLDLSIAVAAGANLSFYVNGIGINRPRIQAIFKK